MAATAKVINLKGNKSNPESAEHIINFPGGSIFVCRVRDNEYWAHIEVHHGQILKEVPRMSKKGLIIDSRLDYDNGEIVDIPNMTELRKVAIKIRMSEN